ncbi:antibiotic transport system ATP-binding protein [Clostridium sp. CAG:411]|jgi:ABC-2 type transport system ATP-binding protein|nr:ATP-binding cassette domain-containing protein [Lachnospiraceae bacterium]CDE45752.1 antibiotic transport system ATP-binding protein [Clostridium sp. CAG:411]
MQIRLVNASRKIGYEMVIDNVNIQFESGHIYGLRGKNGSGKTMLMRAICGLIHLGEGEIWLDDKLLGRDMEFPESVGALLENPGFMENDTAMRNLMTLAEIRNEIGEEEIKNTMEALGLDPYSKKKVKKYSLGMKQKLGIVAAIMEHPKLILLDEPTNALDTESIGKLNVLLQEEMMEYQPIIIIASHDRDELSMLCDTIYKVEKGRVTLEVE